MQMAAPTALGLVLPGPGDPPLTLEEVAQHYRMPERQLRKVIRDRGVEVLRYGHTVRFDRRALSSLEEALRCHAGDQDLGLNDGPTPALSRSSVRSRENASENALKAITSASHRRRLRRSKANSCEPSGTDRVVVLGVSPRR
jgi:hypothetical protein